MSLCMVISVLSNIAIVATADEYKPWSLRDHYSFSSPGASFSFDVSTGEWKVDIQKRGTIVGDAHAEIVLGNGEVLPVPRMTKLSDDRFKFTDP